MRRCQALALALALAQCQWLGARGFFFGFGGGGGDESPAELQRSDRDGCVEWRGADGDLLACDAWLRPRSRGHCACVWGDSRDASQVSERFTCAMLCDADFPAGETDDAGAWLAGTVWNWNDWRDVELQADGQFKAPTPECEQQLDCYWAASGGKVFVRWGESGMHTVALDATERSMRGIRFDGDTCTAKLVAMKHDADDGDDGADDDDDDAGDRLYEVLGVHVDASEADIKKAFRQQSKRLHPDRVAQAGAGGGQDTGGSQDAAAAARSFDAVRSAYEILSDPDTRLLYDTAGLDAAHAFVAAGGREGGQRRARNPMQAMFGGGHGGHGGQAPARGKDMRFSFKVSLADAYNGAEMATQVTRRVICRGCGAARAKARARAWARAKGRGRAGAGAEGAETAAAAAAAADRERCAACEACPPETRLVHRRMGGYLVQQQEEVPSQHRCREEAVELLVHVERGMDDGDTIVFERRAEQTPGEVPGDVVLQVDLDASEQFERDGDDLFTAVHVPLREALTGFSHVFAHLDGHEVKLETEPGRVIFARERRVMAGEGMPVRDVPSEKGDLTVEFDVVFPDFLEPEVKQRLREVLP